MRLAFRARSRRSSHVAPVFRAAATAIGNATLSITIPASVQASDLLVLVVNAINGGTVSTPTGWTLLRHDIGDSTGGRADPFVFYRVAQGGDANTAVVPTVSGRVAATMVAYSKVNTASPFNAQGVLASVSGTAGTTAMTAPAVTTTVDHCVILEVWGSNGSALTIPAASRGQADETVSHSGISEQTQTAPGSTGTQSASQAVASGWVGLTLALSPQ